MFRHPRMSEEVRSQTVLKFCSKCSKIFHNKCSRFSMKVIRNDIFCMICLDTYSIEKYNPYYNALCRHI